ncbi:MAG: hypothetical protein R2831_00580 [Chitinophagaceae bacterium]
MVRPKKALRGNAQYLDLNRDFIKCDSKNARTFTELFQWLQPDVFLDNHVSDGADYPYTMTLLSTQHNKLGGPMAKFLNTQFEPFLYQDMKRKHEEMIPYVNVWGWDAKKGWSQFFDSPRYGSGFGTLHHVYSFVAETHMLKPYPKRVAATYALMQSILDFCKKETQGIKSSRMAQIDDYQKQNLVAINWKLDDTYSEQIPFKGYAYEEKKSSISGLPIYFYNNKKTYDTSIAFKNKYKATIQVSVPDAYIIPQGWWRIIELLKLNGVQMDTFAKDTSIAVSYYRIQKNKTSANAFEGHYMNSVLELETNHDTVYFHEGDVYISLLQKSKRFIIETLEPQAMDSYFTWNFFDAILGQKEGFTPYAFEEKANAFLQQSPALKKLLLQEIQKDSLLAKNHYEQLQFIYEHSPYFEKGYLRYPIYKIETKNIDDNKSNSKSSAPIYNKKDE